MNVLELRQSLIQHREDLPVRVMTHIKLPHISVDGTLEIESLVQLRYTTQVNVEVELRDEKVDASWTVEDLVHALDQYEGRLSVAVHLGFAFLGKSFFTADFLSLGVRPALDQFPGKSSFVILDCMGFEHGA